MILHLRIIRHAGSGSAGAEVCMVTCLFAQEVARLRPYSALKKPAKSKL
jgi:hypothetical protein